MADEIIAVSDKDSFLMTRRLAREEGLLVGGSCGMAVVAALEVAKRLGPDDVVVVLLPDSGRGYLSKIFNDDWMADYGFLNPGTDEPTVAEVCSRKGQGLPDLVHMHPHETVGEAIEMLREYGVSQMPVVKEEPPVMAAEVIGSIVERDLLRALFYEKASPGGPPRRAHVPAAAPGRLRRAGVGAGRRAGAGGRRGGAGRGQADGRGEPPGPAGLPRARRVGPAGRLSVDSAGRLSVDSAGRLSA